MWVSTDTRTHKAPRDGSFTDGFRLRLDKTSAAVLPAAADTQTGLLESEDVTAGRKTKMAATCPHPQSSKKLPSFWSFGARVRAAVIEGSGSGL